MGWNLFLSGECDHCHSRYALKFVPPNSAFKVRHLRTKSTYIYIHTNSRSRSESVCVNWANGVAEKSFDWKFYRSIQEVQVVVV